MGNNCRDYKYKSIIKKKKEKYYKIVLLAKSKLNTISRALIDEFVLINNMLKLYNKMKEEIKILKTWSSLVYL